MTPSPHWHVTRFDLWINPVFDQVVGADPSVTLEVAPLSEPEKGWAALERAHIYQITAAKDELSVQFRATSQLLERCPKLLRVVGVAEPGPRHQVGTRRHRGSRVELQERQPLDDLQQVARPFGVEELGPDRDAAGLFTGQSPHRNSV